MLLVLLLAAASKPSAAPDAAEAATKKADASSARGGGSTGGPSESSTASSSTSSSSEGGWLAALLSVTWPDSTSLPLSSSSSSSSLHEDPSSRTGFAAVPAGFAATYFRTCAKSDTFCVSVALKSRDPSGFHPIFFAASIIESSICFRFGASTLARNAMYFRVNGRSAASPIVRDAVFLAFVAAFFPLSPEITSNVLVLRSLYSAMRAATACCV